MGFEGSEGLGALGGYQCCGDFEELWGLPNVHIGEEKHPYSFHPINDTPTNFVSMFSVIAS